MHPFQQAALIDAVNGCMACSIYKNGKKVLGYGSFDDDPIVLVGEAPGRDEAESGTPFIGKAGQTLRKMINEVGIDWKKIYITNTIKCRPTGNRDPEIDEINNCAPFLAAQLYALQPSLVIPVGRIAFYHFVDTSEKITDAAGKIYKLYQDAAPLRISKYRELIKNNFPIDTDRVVFSVIIPILHPSYIDRCGGENSNEFKSTVKILERIWQDYLDKKGWYSLLNDIPF